MKSSGLKIILLLIAIAGVAAIGWYLLMGDGSRMVERTDSGDTVPVEQPAETRPADEASTGDAPATPSEPATTTVMDTAEFEAMSADDVAARYNQVHEVERAAFLTDYVRAVGENKGVTIAREVASGPVEERNYELSFALAQVLVAEFDSRLGSYLAGVHSMNGQGTERDLDAATRYLRHPELLETSGALYFRAVILLDEDYERQDRDAAIALLKKAVKVGDPDENGVIQSRKLLDELGAE
ncbi:hypothetical protein [Minwuia sp.]|uniref:hypothetical protein n=1 Tax=Minwuia sp. TaxID=2493630 RepID=UPI003A9226FD